QDRNNQRRECHGRTDEPWHSTANGKPGERNDEPGRGNELANQGKAFWREHGLCLGCAGAVGEERSSFVAPAGAGAQLGVYPPPHAVRGGGPRASAVEGAC